MQKSFEKNTADIYPAYFIFRRALSSSSVDGVCAMLNHACTLLGGDFRDVLYSRLRQGFPSGFDFAQAYSLVQSSIQTGKLQSADQETERGKAAFLVKNITLSPHIIMHAPLFEDALRFQNIIFLNQIFEH